MRGPIILEKHGLAWVRRGEMSPPERMRAIAALTSPSRELSRLLIGSKRPLPPSTFNGLLRSAPFPRLHVVLSGVFRVSAVTVDGTVDAQLGRGEAAYWPPSSCSEEHWDRRCEVIGIALHPAYIRLVRMRNSRDSAASGRDLAAWHAISPLSSAGMAIAGILDGFAEDAGAAHAALPLFTALLTVIAAELGCDTEPTAESGSAATWSRALGFVEDHLGDPINRETVARALAVHPNHLSRLASRHAGRPFKDLLRDLRLRRAVELLVGTDLALGRVAEACGYGSVDHFIKVFRREKRLTPARFRKQRPIP
jgi:AraC-like DNA-binding protein